MRTPAAPSRISSVSTPTMRNFTSAEPARSSSPTFQCSPAPLSAPASSTPAHSGDTPQPIRHGSAGLHEGPHAPAWSPDSSRIAFVRDPGGGTELWVMNADGGVGVVWRGTRRYLDSPQWSPNAVLIVVGDY